MLLLFLVICIRQSKKLTAACMILLNNTSLLTQTITKSRQVQALVKYRHRPNATHLSNISMKKSTAKTMLTILRMNISSSLSWRLMSSKHSERLEAKMSSKMVHSKKGLSTMS